MELRECNTFAGTSWFKQSHNQLFQKESNARSFPCQIYEFKPRFNAKKPTSIDGQLAVNYPVKSQLVMGEFLELL